MPHSNIEIFGGPRFLEARCSRTVRTPSGPALDKVSSLDQQVSPEREARASIWWSERKRRWASETRTLLADRSSPFTSLESALECRRGRCGSGCNAPGFGYTDQRSLSGGGRRCCHLPKGIISRVKIWLEFNLSPIASSGLMDGWIQCSVDATVVLSLAAGN